MLKVSPREDDTDAPRRTLAGLQAELREARAVILQYADTDLNPMTAFVVSPDSVAARVLGWTRDVLPDARVAVALMAAGEPDDAVAPPLGRLGAALLDPLMPLVPAGTERVFVIAPAALAEVPFEALFTVAPGSGDPFVTVKEQTLSDRVAVSYLPSAFHLMTLLSHAKGTGMVAFADPGTASDDSEAEPVVSPSRALRNTPLPHARREVRAIAPRGARLHLGSDATREALWSAEARSAAVLHFATHAWVARLAPERSALLLADAAVTAAEIETLSVLADLVSLSGCRTGGGLVSRGQGTSGLPRAFLIAGAASVVASRWDVDDRAATRLMTLFYEGLRDGLPRDEALRRAGRVLRDDGVPHRDRSAFRLWGPGHLEVAALVGQATRGTPWWLTGLRGAIISLAAAALAAWALRRRVRA